MTIGVWRDFEYCDAISAFYRDKIFTSFTSSFGDERRIVRDLQVISDGLLNLGFQKWREVLFFAHCVVF